MENNGKKRVTVEKASSAADLILEHMKIDTLYPWPEWWATFIRPIDSYPFMSLDETNDRHNLKELINDEFVARNLTNRLFVDWNKGVFMLDGDTAVASRFFLGRVKKIANSVNTTIDSCRELGMANGLSDKDSRMLLNATGTIDGNLTTLTGAIGRMTSIPREVRRAALLHMGVDL